MIRASLAAIAACVTAVFLYAAVRGLQLVLFPDPNPATVIWSAHAGYFWRAWIVAYAGGMAAMVAWIFAGRDPARVARALVRALTFAALAIAIQGVFLP